MNNVETFPIVNEEYRFECTRCGNCCTGDQRVWLNPGDLKRMAVYLGYDHTEELFRRKLVVLEQGENGAWRPRILFKQYKKLRFCPFLENHLDEDGAVTGLCRLHPRYKPLICSLAPLGRRWDAKTEKSEWIFVKPAPDCPGVNSEKLQLLRDTLERHIREIEAENLFFAKLQGLLESNSKQPAYRELYFFETGLGEGSPG